MASVNISLTEEAYRYLKMLKDKNKSFSDVILEIKREKFRKGSKENVLKFAGILKDKKIDWKQVDRNMKEFRKDFDEGVKRTGNYMKK